MTNTDTTSQPRHRRNLTGSLRRFFFGARPQPHRAPGDLPRLAEPRADEHAPLEEPRAA